MSAPPATMTRESHHGPAIRERRSVRTIEPERDLIAWPHDRIDIIRLAEHLEHVTVPRVRADDRPPGRLRGHARIVEPVWSETTAFPVQLGKATEVEIGPGRLQRRDLEVFSRLKKSLDVMMGMTSMLQHPASAKARSEAPRLAPTTPTFATSDSTPAAISNPV